MKFRVENLDVGSRHDVTCGDLGRTLYVDAKRHGFVTVHPKDEVLEVQNDVGDVFGNTLDGVEFMECLVEPHLSDGCAGD